MMKKEKMELLLSKVPEEQKAAFVAELREARTKEAMQDLLKKYGIRLTDEEEKTLCATENELSDADLDQAAGGCENTWQCENDCS